MSPTNPTQGPSSHQRRVGLEEVARAADVSVATASRALSGRPVRPALLERVRTAARDLGYRPDLAAQAVARGTTNTVSLIVDYLRSSFGVEITKGVVDAASRRGLVVNVTGAETHPGDLLEMIASARALRPRALVLATGRVQDPSIRDALIRDLDAYQASGGSVAIVDGLDLPFASCAFDEVTAAHALAAELVRMGYRRPLVFNSSAERADLAGRTHTLIEALRAAGVAQDDIALVETPTEVSAAADDDTLIELAGADVVLCVEGAVLPEVYRHIQGRGMSVGGDVGVVAFGQYSIANALRPHLSTVMLPLRRAGELALEHALSDTEGAHLSLPCNLRIRASTPLRADGPGRSRKHVTAGATSGPVTVILPAMRDADVGTVSRVLLSLADAEDRRCVVTNESSFLRQTPVDEGGPGGVIVWGPVSPSVAEKLDEQASPCVVVDVPRTGAFTRLVPEVAEGMQNLLERLYAYGHTRILYASGVENDPFEAQRRWGIDLFTATHRDVTLTRIDGTDARWAERAASALTEGATALVVHDDADAARAVRVLDRAGIEVPSGVSVAAFGQGVAGEWAVPALFTVQPDVEALARTAWRLLREGAPMGHSHALRSRIVSHDSIARVSPV